MKIASWEVWEPVRDSNGRPVLDANDKPRVRVVDSHDITREGRRIRQGGDGVVFMCGCPKGNMYPVRLCKHLQHFVDSAKTGTLDPHLRLTAAGRRAATRCGCSESIRESER